MTSYKLYKPLLLSLSLALTACGSDSDDDDTSEVTTPETTPGVTELSVANPIADITLIANVALDFSIPAGTCTAAEGVEVSQLITGVTNNVGFGITNFTAMSGLATEIGEVTVTVTCSTETEEVTDEFTITVVDFEADPVVEINTPAVANHDEVLTLTAVAQDQNLSGSIASYSWKVTSEATIVLIDEDSSTVSFTVPDTPTQTTATLEVTVTDNDGNTATDTVEIDLISSNAPDVSLSFPLALGVYNEDEIDMFGYVDFADPHNPATVTVNVNIDGIDHAATITDSTWRVEDITIVENADIKVIATSSDGFINYEEITLVNNAVFVTSIDNNISDIAVNDETDEIYVHSDGSSSADNSFNLFNLTSTSNNKLDVTQESGFTFSNYRPTSLALDTTSNLLFVSYEIGISQIDLNTGNETVLSETPNTAGAQPGFVMDLAYNSISDTLYAAEFSNKVLSSIDIDTGARTEVATELDQLLSVTTSGFDNVYLSQGANLNYSAAIGKNNGTTAPDYLLTTIAGEKGGPISDMTIDAINDHLYFVDGNGSLIQLDLADNSTTEIVTSLFYTETLLNAATPLIGLHYHTERNVVIAAGRDADGTNKLLVIDPVSGDYAKVATGTVD
jgi:hypothetical protein